MAVYEVGSRWREISCMIAGSHRWDLNEITITPWVTCDVNGNGWTASDEQTYVCMRCKSKLVTQKRIRVAIGRP